MPLLLMRSFPGTLLDQSCRASVRRQIEYGDEHGMPWGISESAYAVTDRAGNYQYKAFGVPGPRAEARALGRPGGRSVRDRAGEPRSIPPPRRQNFRAAGPPGARRALRLLRSDRLQAARPRPTAAPASAGDAPHPVIVRAFFAHHQGMSLVALANVVCDDVFVDAVSRAIAACRPPSCCSRSGCRARRFSSEPRPAEGARRLAVGSGGGIAAVPIAAHRQSAHALPVERPLHRRADARRRRLQHLARPGGHAAAGGSDVRCRRAFHLPARSVVGRCLVAPRISRSAASRTSTR